MPRTAGYRQPVAVLGTIDAVAGDTTVALYKRAVDATTETLVDGAVPVTWDTESRRGVFSVVVTGLTKNTVLTAVWGGDEQYLGATAKRTAGVMARVGLSATVRSGSVRLAARVSPAQAGASVIFQRWTASGWKKIAAVKTAADGYARATWNPSAGSYRVRAAFTDSAINRAAKSRTIAVLVP